MKHFKNLVFTTLMLFTLLLAVPAIARAEGVTMSDCQDDEITITWEKPSVNGEIQSYKVYDENNDTCIASTLSAEATGCVFNQLAKGYVGYWKVVCIYTNGAGTEYTNIVGYVHVNTTPAQMSAKSIVIDNVSSDSGRLSFQVAKPDNMTGTQVQLYQGSKKVASKKFTGEYSSVFSFSCDKVYKYRARTYYVNESTGKTYYGAWSSCKYFDCPTATGTYASDTRGCKITLKKVSNVSSYVIYVSKNKDSGFKKTTTVKITSGKKKTVSIKKIGDSAMKKGTYYYIKIVPKITVGDSTKTSEIFSILGFRNPR